MIMKDKLPMLLNMWDRWSIDVCSEATQKGRNSLVLGSESEDFKGEGKEGDVDLPLGLVYCLLTSLDLFLAKRRERTNE